VADEAKQGDERTPYVTLGRAVSMKRGIAFLTCQGRCNDEPILNWPPW
jgi:hypothetical protein